MNVQSVTHPADHDLTIDHFRESQCGIRASTIFDIRYLTKDGSILWAQVGMTVISDAQGQPSVMRYR